MSENRQTLVVSAVNFYEGGPLSLLNDCLMYLNCNNELISKYKILALVHKKELFPIRKLSNISFIEIPSSRKSYIHRFYFEYLYFKKFAKENNVNFWLSLHDITPNVGNINQAVYCHNPSIFNEFYLRDIFVQPTLSLFKMFYKYVYKINIKRNRYVIVQQNWIKEKFCEVFGLSPDKIIVAPPQVPVIPDIYLNLSKAAEREETVFFFPTYPRSFKNIEVICEAVKVLNRKKVGNFTVMLTIDGTENKYAELVYKTYKNEPNLSFIGLLSRDEVYKKYADTDCLIFPSKLETWGLPISEFKQYNKPILVADLPYAKETIGKYDKVKFFQATDADELANYMENIILKAHKILEKTEAVVYQQPVAENWDELFFTLLNK